MSRAINLSADTEAVNLMCDKHKVQISTIEPLPSGGTRVVLRTRDGADIIRHQMRKQVISGPVVRGGLYLSRIPATYVR
jgi:hypothetical protein